MKKIFSLLCFIGLSVVSGCSSSQVAQVQSYADAVKNTCQVGLGLVSAMQSLNIPSVVLAVDLLSGACTTDIAVTNLIESPTSVAWLNTLLTTIKTQGKVVPPPPVEKI